MCPKAEGFVWGFLCAALVLGLLLATGAAAVVKESWTIPAVEQRVQNRERELFGLYGLGHYRLDEKTGKIEFEYGYRPRKDEGKR